MSKPKHRRSDGPMHSACEEYQCPCHGELQRLTGILNCTKSGQLILEEFFYKPKKETQKDAT